MTNNEKREILRLIAKRERVIRSRGQKRINIPVIIKLVSNISGLDIHKKTQAKEYVVPRQVAHYMAAKLTRESLGNIGHEIGKKDHATVINSRRQVENYILTNDRLIWPYLNLFEKYNLL
jgi:chromosomal replication initiator protein